MPSDSVHQPAVKPLAKEMRLMLAIGTVLPFLAGLSLFVGTSRTADYSAWTINSEITAAFIGAAYWSGMFLTLLSAFERSWAQARVAVPAVLAFTVLGLVSTILHYDRFHTDDGSLVTQFVTWLWLAPYALGLVVFLVIVARQLRLPGGDSPREAPLPAWARAVLGAQAAVLLAVGAILFITPVGVADAIWPWPLTELTGRVVAAWLIAFGVGAAHVVYENDWARTRAAAVSYAVLGVLEIIVLLRYAGDVDWGGARLLLLLTFLVSVIAMGAYGFVQAQRSRGAIAGPPRPRPAAS